MNEPNATNSTAEAPKASQMDAEFVDLKGLHQGFGIKRSLAYKLLAERVIRGVSLRRHGCVRGKRLFSVASVRAYLNQQMESPGHD
jgi:hypothetical protein